MKGYSQITEEQIKKSRELVERYLKKINEQLNLNTFIIGERLSIVDISAYHDIKTVKK
jgi:glutathione S-transferase